MKVKVVGKSTGCFRKFGFGLAAGVVGGFVLGHKWARRRQMPYLELWQEVLETRYGEVKAAVLATRMQNRYDDMFASRPRLSSRALRYHLELSVLPGVALYQILAEEKKDKDSALAEFAPMLEKSLEPLKEAVSSLARFSDPYGTFRAALGWALRLVFPVEGWKLEVLENSHDAIAFDVSRCFYQDMFQYYETPELMTIYCNLEHKVFSRLPPSIAWARTTSLSGGDGCCNYRWNHVRTEVNERADSEKRETPVVEKDSRSAAEATAGATGD